MVAAAAVVGTAASLVVAAPAASAAGVSPVVHLGASAGSRVTAASGVLVSDPTAVSYVQGITYPAANSNGVADAHVTDLLTTGAVQTSERAVKTDTGTQLVSHARTAALDVLNGLIKVAVADTVSTATYDGSTLAASTTTQLTRIRIVNVDLPVNIPQNYGVTIPGVARVMLNYNQVYEKNGTIVSSGAAIYLILLADHGNYPAGLSIVINPTYSALTTHLEGKPVIVGGTSFASRLTAHVADAIAINAGPSAQSNLGSNGTHGQTLTTSTAAITIPGVLEAGALQTTVNGTTDLTSGDALTTARIAGVNLFDGLITADAITSSARSQLATDGTFTLTDKSEFVNLTINGHAYPLNAARNTVIDVAGLGKITLNKQLKSGFYTQNKAVVITLSTARAGLPIGAVIELAVSSAYVLS